MNYPTDFLSLVRFGIGHDSEKLSGLIDWNAINALADKQGLSAVVLDGIGYLPEDNRPLKLLLLNWIDEVMQSYENRYDLYKRTIAEMAAFYNSHGFKMMVLKGYSCSIDWPKPEHRPCGDIDIWLFGKQKEADALLSKEKGIKIDNSHHHHKVFDWHGFTVENHYDFVNVYAERSSFMIEKVFKELGENDSHSVEIFGEKVYLSSPNLHALFLIRHMVSHFAAAEITLRHVLDWAFFVEKHTKEIDWEWLIDVLKKFHMIEFYNTINAICLGDLGFDAKIFPSVQFHPDLKDKVLKDILYPKYSASEPSRLIPRLVYKYRRW